MAILLWRRILAGKGIRGKPQIASLKPQKLSGLWSIYLVHTEQFSRVFHKKASKTTCQVWSYGRFPLKWGKSVTGFSGHLANFIGNPTRDLWGAFEKFHAGWGSEHYAILTLPKLSYLLISLPISFQSNFVANKDVHGKRNTIGVHMVIWYI